MDSFYILLLAWLVSILVIVISIAWSIDYADAITDEELLTADREIWTSGWGRAPSRTRTRKNLLIGVAAVESALMVFIPMLTYSYPEHNSYRNVTVMCAYSVGILVVLGYGFWKKTRNRLRGQRDFQCLYRTQLEDTLVMVSIATYALAVVWFVYSYINR